MSSTTLPVHPTLLDPRTGEPLEAIGWFRGRPLWPMMGGAPEPGENDDQDDEDDDEGQEPDDDADDDQDDDAKDDDAKGRRAVKKKNSENVNLRKRLKAAEDRLREIDDAGKSESEKNAERLAELEKQAADLPRLRVALRKGLTEQQAARLVGTTEEELEADADAYLEELGVTSKTDKTDKVKTRPRTALKGGSKPDDEPDETDPRKLAAAVPKRGGRGGF